MKKNKPDIIKLNILTIILTLICISCAADKINPKESTKNLEDLDSLNKKNQETKVSKLEKFGKKLEAQKEKDSAEIATIDTTAPDFLGPLKTQPYQHLGKNDEMNIKRIIYSSLNYEKQKIDTLKEILEKLLAKPEHQKILERFLYSISLMIQSRLNKGLDKIKKKANTLSEENYNALLIDLESNLKLKENFKKVLNKTIEAYNQDLEKIKSNKDKLAKHMDENYKNLHSFKTVYY
ncbi:complement regulator-acquiring protein [Borreliella bavariensis]|uniref:complement regulator-acquiring protein n=1 Tax=Borreliella bavariensis TaxID=664662 RepID=UPI001C00D619|nr:complement regulator-acquiring protein [Borreliella bavariensis]